MHTSRLERASSYFTLSQIGRGGSWRPGGPPKYFQRPRTVPQLTNAVGVQPYIEGSGPAVVSSAELLASSRGRRLNALDGVPFRTSASEDRATPLEEVGGTDVPRLEGETSHTGQLNLLEAYRRHGPPSLAADNGNGSSLIQVSSGRASGTTPLWGDSVAARRKSSGLQLDADSSRVTRYFDGESDPSRSDTVVKNILLAFDEGEVARHAAHQIKEQEWARFKERNGYYMRPTSVAGTNNSELARTTYEPMSASHHQFPLTSSASLRPQMMELPKRAREPAAPFMDEEAVVEDYDDFVVDGSHSADAVLHNSSGLNTSLFEASFDPSAKVGSLAAVRPFASGLAGSENHGQSTAGMRGAQISLQSTSSTTIAHDSNQVVSPEIIDLVTEEFASIREKEILRRRRVLYELTHPIPTDYTFGGKLVPPPPLAFGKVTEEAVELGRQMMQGQTYSHVRTSPHSDYFFEINDLYMEIAMVGRANAGKSSLINGLLGQHVAKTSSTPNSTRGVNFYQAATPEELKAYMGRNPSRLVKLPAAGLQLTFVDLPGFGISGMSDKWRDNAIAVTDSYMGVRRSLNTVVMCVDATKGFTPTDERYFKWIENIHGLFYVVLTKCDAISHHHLCNLMRKIYQAITDRGGGEAREQSKKFNAVYPFVIPVSARTGANMDLLRGLLVETSGLIQGHKLRSMLKRKVEEANRHAEVNEVLRIEAARELERQIGIEEFSGRSVNGHASNDTAPCPPPTTKETAQTTPPPPNRQYTVPSIIELNRSMLERHMKQFPSRGRASEVFDDDVSEGAKQLLKKFNLGVKDLDGLVNVGGDDGCVGKDALGADGQPSNGVVPSSVPIQRKQGAAASQVLGLEPLSTSGSDEMPATLARRAGGGTVSAFMDAVDKYEEDRNQQSKEFWSDAQRSHHGASRSKAQRQRHALLVEQPDGVLKAVKGRVVSGAIMSTTKGGSVVPLTPGAKRKHDLIKEASTIRPAAPWAASGESVREKLQRLKDHVKLASHDENGVSSSGARKSTTKIKMSKSELATYLKTSGKTIQEFEQFESEVLMKAFRNDRRQMPGSYQRAEARVSDSSRISFSSMPAGMWKKYGRQNSYRPTGGTVLGT